MVARPWKCEKVNTFAHALHPNTNWPFERIFPEICDSICLVFRNIKIKFEAIDSCDQVLRRIQAAFEGEKQWELCEILCKVGEKSIFHFFLYSEETVSS